MSSLLSSSSSATRQAAQRLLTPVAIRNATTRIPSILPTRMAQRTATTQTSEKHPPIKSTSSVVGTHNNPTLDLNRVQIGQTIEVPYEATIDNSHQTMWQSTFQIHDRLFTSTPYAQSLSLPNHVVPFYMVLFKAISMGHVDETRNVLDIGFDHAVYIRPVYPGVTLHQTFTIKHIKMTSNGENTLLTVGCELFNERKQLVFSVDKVMLYPGVKVPSFRMSAPPKNRPALPRSHLLDHILYNADNLSTNTNLAILNPGQLLLHSVSRCIGKSANMALSTLFRWTHPSIYNLKRYKDEELLVPGGLILAASIAASSRGLFETLNESLDSCLFLNKVSPLDLIGAVSYIQSIRQLKEGIEEVKVVTLGLKNIDVARELHGVSIPTELFTHSLHRKQVEALVSEYAPILSGKIVVKSNRTIIRQSPFAQQRSIPLL